MRSFVRTADGNGNIVSAIPRGIGFVLIPAGNAPGSFPSGMTVDLQGSSWGALPVAGPDVMFFKEPFEVGHVRGCTPNGTYLCVSLQDRKEDIRVSTQTAQSTAIATLEDDQTYNVATNDPVSRGDNGVGALGLPITNGSFARCLIQLASSTFAAGTIRTWLWDPVLKVWLLNPDLNVAVPVGLASRAFSDQQIGAGWGRIFFEALNVTAAAGTPVVKVFTRVSAGA